MTPALRNAAAMRNGQFTRDNSEPPGPDAQELMEDQVEKLLDEGDSDTTTAFAEFAYDRMHHAEIIDAMAALFRGTNPKWRNLRDRLREDVVSEPLYCLRTGMGEHRAAFIKARAAELLGGVEK